MKVILLKDVAKMGRKGSVVEVPDGFALNQLIPKKLAEAATATNLKKIQNTITTTAQQNQTEDQKYNAVVTALQTETLKISADSNAQGHLFKAIHEIDIEGAAKERDLVLPKGIVLIEKPIKSLGQHEIILKRGAMKNVCIIEIIKKV